jgi:hypothetical protein
MHTVASKKLFLRIRQGEGGFASSCNMGYSLNICTPTHLGLQRELHFMKALKINENNALQQVL